MIDMAPSLETHSVQDTVKSYQKGPLTDRSEDYARQQDAKDPLRHLRDEFIIPSRSDLKMKKIEAQDHTPNTSDSHEAIYLCGNSLGLQPRRTKKYVQKYLDTWASKAVTGHFSAFEDSLTPAWIDMDDAAAEGMATVVGANKEEVAVMDTLTGNLHLAMASFYRPTKKRYKIIIEEKAFPSDHYAIESQIYHHNLSPADALVLVSPPHSTSPYLPLSHIYSIIDRNASDTMVLLLPGIQYYSGQLLDIKAITVYAQERGIVVGWDLAHAAGNVPLQLHDWNVDFAVWCTYKYLNAGAGATGGLFVHERHGHINHHPDSTNSKANEGESTASHTPNGTTKTNEATKPTSERLPFRHRLAGWWGSDKNTRFQMEPTFRPRPGAAGFQLSNPSALDMTSVLATLSIFKETDMNALRAKSVALTAYLEDLLLHDAHTSTPSHTSLANCENSSATASIATSNGHQEEKQDTQPYTLITPSSPSERGAQLSIRLEPGLLDEVMAVLAQAGVVVDERKPDVVRVAPAPLYNSFVDVWRFVEVWRRAVARAVEKRAGRGGE